MMIDGVHIMEADMLFTKPGRQLGLFARASSVQVRMPEKTTLKIKSLLAELLAGVWLSHPKKRGEKPVFRGGHSE
ncbi:MAG: hypothetical protein WBC70_18725 [Candidatus Aminicenantales bacterium]